MARLQDLGLTNEQVGQPLDYGTMPDQMGGFTEPPYPGPYRFRLPKDLSGIWEVFDHPNGHPPGKRIRAKFDDAHPLTIVQSQNGANNGEPFLASISNAERRRGKKDDAAAPFISDMDYMNRDVWGLTTKPGRGTNQDYAAEFMKHADTEFAADVEWNWFCNPKKDIYAAVPDPTSSTGTRQVEQAGTKGCNTSYYQKDIKDGNLMVPGDPNDPQSPLVYPLRITCQCGASVRAFPNLVRYRA